MLIHIFVAELKTGVSCLAMGMLTYIGIYFLEKNGTPIPGPVWWLNRGVVMFSNDNCPLKDELKTMEKK